MLKIYKQSFIFLILIFVVIHAYAAVSTPVPIDSVDYNKIHHKKVRKLISMQKEYGLKTFDEINTVCYDSYDSLDYNTFEKSQIIRQDINRVWDNLIHQSPSEEFDGRIVTFGLLYSKHHHNLLYKNEAVTGIEEGQILFFNLRMLRGIKNLAVGLEVTRLDNEEKIIEYCYVDHGDTRGTQKFILKSTAEGFTEIKQITKYQCKSRLRDRRLYSFFHERIVNELFKSIKHKSEDGTRCTAGL